MNSVFAIVITYFPDKAVLEAQLNALLPQVARVVIVDDGSSAEHLTWLGATCDAKEKLHFLPLHDNLGIAKAQNVGILWAKEQQAEYVLLMDQDSLPAHDMVDLLLSSYQALNNANEPICAIGPRFIDVDSGNISSHVKFGLLSIKRISCPDESVASQEKVIRVDFLISSGSLIPIQIFEKVGLMDESLFIDHVDTEWILRAKSMGYEAYGDCEARMNHSLGEHRIEFWFGRKRDIPIHNAFRYYYIFRNSLVLYRRSYMGWHWKWVDFIRLLQLSVFMTVFSRYRRLNTKMIWRGVVAGIRRESGKIPD